MPSGRRGFTSCSHHCFSRPSLRSLELLDHMPVGGERHGGRVTRLPSDFDDRCALSEEGRAEEMAEEGRTGGFQPDGGSGRRVHPSSPVPIRRVSPRLSFLSWEDKRLWTGATARELPLDEVSCKRTDHSHCPRLAGLRLLHFAERESLLDD